MTKIKKNILYSILILVAVFGVIALLLWNSNRILLSQAEHAKERLDSEQISAYTLESELQLELSNNDSNDTDIARLNKQSIFKAQDSLDEGSFIVITSSFGEEDTQTFTFGPDYLTLDTGEELAYPPSEETLPIHQNSIFFDIAAHNSINTFVTELNPSDLQFESAHAHIFTFSTSSHPDAELLAHMHLATHFAEIKTIDPTFEETAIEYGAPQDTAVLIRLNEDGTINTLEILYEEMEVNLGETTITIPRIDTVVTFTN